jgi:hypothetical protein
MPKYIEFWRKVTGRRTPHYRAIYTLRALNLHCTPASLYEGPQTAVC